MTVSLGRRRRPLRLDRLGDTVADKLVGLTRWHVDGLARPGHSSPLWVPESGTNIRTLVIAAPVRSWT